MGRTAKRLAILTGLLSLTTAVAPVLPAQAAPLRGGPFLVDNLAYPAVLSGKSRWVKMWWSTDSDICDVRVTVSGRRVDVFYPSNTEPYTSFYRADSLEAEDYDYTAFRVTANADEVRQIDLNVDVTFTRLPDGTLPSRSADCHGPRGHRTTTTHLLVLPD